MPMNPRLLRPRLSGDPDALRYIAAVQQADGNTLEPAIRKAITDFVVGCKQDGIWSAIKASCILMGARTLSGALTPLVGSAPTNVNFVSGDYNRKTGLVGDGSTKYLQTGRNLSTSDSQNDHHAAVFPTLLPQETLHVSDFGPLLAARASGTGDGSVQVLQAGPTNATPNTFQFVSTGGSAATLGKATARLAGLSRSASGSYAIRGNNTSSTITQASAALANANWLVFARTVGGTGENFTQSRLAFYSVGSSLTLSLLDSRVTTLYNAIGAAIP